MDLCDAGRTEGDSILELVAEHGSWPTAGGHDDRSIDATAENPAPQSFSFGAGRGTGMGRLLAGVVVLFVQIGALRAENPLHDKHLRFRLFRELSVFRADWCASSQAPLRGRTPRVLAIGQVRPLRSGRETPA
jgi:hypothetical protein